MSENETTKETTQSSGAEVSSSLTNALVEGFVAQVQPMLEIQKAPKFVMDSWENFCNSLREWASGKTDEPPKPE